MRVMLALLLSLAGPVCAQGLPSEEELTADTLLDAIAGRTVAMYSGATGGLVGLERFATRERSYWRRSDGTCALGDVSVAEGLLCFRYDDKPGEKFCWQPLYHDGEPAVRLRGSGEVQIMRDAGDTPVDCTIVPTS